MIDQGSGGIQTFGPLDPGHSALDCLIPIAGDRIKGLILRHINVYCGTTAVQEAPQYTRYYFIPRVLRLMYCGEATFKFIAAAVKEPQYTRDKNSLCTAAGAIDKVKPAAAAAACRRG